MRKILRLYPLAFTGNLVLVGSVYLLGVAYATRNAYALLFGLLALLFLLTLIVCVFTQYALYRLAEVRTIQQERLVARSAHSQLTVIASGVKPFFFFRLHVALRADLAAGRDASLQVRLESVADAVSQSEGRAQIPLWLPVCGELSGQLDLMVRDVFLLTRISLGDPLALRTIVSPPPVPDQIPLRFEMQFNAETGQRKSVAEEEKYYMREYIPGDRPKDINWKSSIRVQELITRISPYAPERTYVICLELRNVAAEAADNPESIMHLNYLKSWLLSFMYQVRRENSAFQFFLRTARSAHTLHDEAEIDAFVPELARMSFQSDFQPGVEGSHQEKFIFSTIFDTGLPAYLASQQRIRCNVFRTARKGKEARKVHFLPLDQSVVRPSFWLFRRPGPRLEERAGPALMWMDNPLKVHIF